MEEKKRISLLHQRDELATPQVSGMKEGIPIEKGVVVTEEFMIKNEALMRRYLEYFCAYPDLFLDIIKSEDRDIELFFYQRVMLRALMRFTEVYWTAGRATAKTFLSVLALFLQCVFIPGKLLPHCLEMSNEKLFQSGELLKLILP